MTSLWIEKYRPKSIEDYNCPAHLKNFLTKYKENFPHLLLYGPPGTGKTTFAHLISHKNKLELNASHERGINVIRGTIKNFASSISSKNTIILDECELLTPDAQQCLRRIIEDFTNTRFIFITNYPSKIILPLKSRLLALKFDYDNKEVLEKIKLQNSLNINVNDLVNLCNNDLRKAINAMQSIAPLKEYDMNMIFGQINEEELGLFFTDKNFASKFMRMNYCIINFINQLSDVLFIYGDESCVSEFLIVLSDVEEKAALGCNDEILLSYLVTKRIEIFK